MRKIARRFKISKCFILGLSALALAPLVAAGCGLDDTEIEEISNDASTATATDAIANADVNVTDSAAHKDGSIVIGGDAGFDSGVCPIGQSLCSGVCLDTQNDKNNCGACGHVCPSSGGVAACAAGNCLSLTATTFNTKPGATVDLGTIQSYVVPANGTYQIEAMGAQGATCAGHAGGDGADVIGTFILTGGTTLDILVGQKGDNPGGAGGGGGGSFVVVHGSAAPLIVGGGGGGAGGLDPGANALTTSIGNSGGAKGGGYSTSDHGGGGGGGGGGGFGSSGAKGDDANLDTSAMAGGGGFGSLYAGNGGAGGGGAQNGINGTGVGGNGGFGGGGAGGGSTYYAGGGGGGGGQTGGGGGSSSAGASGGGGAGSFNSGTSATAIANHTGDGQIKITPK